VRIVVQRVAEARVTVAGTTVGAIGRGLLLLVGVGPHDTMALAATLAEKAARLRIFADDAGKLNLAALDINAAVLVVSQFTLYADLSHGRRPSFAGAAPPDLAAPLVAHVATVLRGLGLQVAQGQFGAHMQVALVNDGPVTLILEG
jgi:D-tyrosyl-tRNA(Tyr) deacylase